MKIPEFKLNVILYLFSEKEGGRSREISSGYRPNIVFSIDEDKLKHFYIEGKGFYIPGDVVTYNSDGIFILDPDKVVIPGENCRCYLYLYFPAFVKQFLYPGAFFLVREGGIVVGSGRILNSPEFLGGR